MAILKCKMCGGDISFELGESVGNCEFCGSRQTLPRLNSDEKKTLYDRANHFRRNNEYDKAISIYEQILSKDTTDSEAYWSLVLCNYGIEYVEDSLSRKRVPTVNRLQFTSIFDDENYKAAIKYSDDLQRIIYEEEAKTINDIQKGILSISQKEDPFDVFICYKETDTNGRRTPDSVLAYDLYNQLIQEGMRVFFAHVTLEDKLGVAYEPYIFAALNSAKVMVVLGTKKEYFEAVWVKNEWNRYLSLVKKSQGKKVLIPAYKDMDPYDLPREFSHLQAQDMSKLGCMQDIVRGIRKITEYSESGRSSKEKVIIQAHTSVEPLLKRAFIFLEDENWAEADAYCEKVLDQDPENAQAYIGKLMAELHVRCQEDLSNCTRPFNNSNNFKKAVRYGNDDIVGMLSGFITIINDRNKKIHLTEIYNNAVNAMKLAKSESEYKRVAEIFKTIEGFMNSDSLAEQCINKVEEYQKEEEILQEIKSIVDLINEKYDPIIKELQLKKGELIASRNQEKVKKELEIFKLKGKENSIGLFDKQRKFDIQNEILSAENELKSLIKPGAMELQFKSQIEELIREKEKEVKNAEMKVRSRYAFSN